MSDEISSRTPDAPHHWRPHPEILSERFEDALALAASAHRNQRRKGSEIAYVGHLLGVCALVIEEGGNEDEAIAALLHDVVEDQGGKSRLEEIRERFGDRVATIVRACSDRIGDDGHDPTEQGKDAWRARKEEYLEHLEHQPPEVLIVSLADKLYNARAISRDYTEIGEALWPRFTGERDGTVWYYRSLSEKFSRLLPTCRMSRELEQITSSLAEEVGSDPGA